MHDDTKRFNALRFAYVCGKLEAHEAAWMADMLATHPEWQARCDADHDLLALTRAALGQGVAESAPLVSFERVEQIRASAQRPWWGARLRATLVRAWAQPMPAGWAAGAMAMLLVVLGVQSVQWQRQDDEASAYRGVEHTGTAARAGTVAVIFSDRLTVAELRQLGARLQFQVVAGPDEQGVFEVIPAAGASVGSLLGALKADPAVLDAHLAPRGR